MFGSLFEENSSSFSERTVSLGPTSPPRPRQQCKFAGIDNQGATCYLNSLLQTLLLTPEFRESLFQLSEHDLGKLEDKDKCGSRVRVIPIQLQRLFLRLLLSNRQSVSTAELTQSFGWTNHEEFHQHDAQELNRILFSAIEDSLIGTPGQTLIRELYHGTIVNQIKCLKCGNISEREENFLDLTVTIAERSGLEHALKNCYCDEEKMEGCNQYSCENCRQLVDAIKAAKLRSLPPILTVSLLRFSFDFVKMTRYKETGKFTFPLCLDMSPYIEKKSTDKAESQYELFSVVIHRGSAYGGHYHAYIRDVDCLGFWSNPEKIGVQVPIDPASGKSDFINCESPVDLVQVILSKAPNRSMSVDKLCAEMYKQTGVSWNKRYKKAYGGINKFLSKHGDKFLYNPDVNWVSLQDQNICQTFTDKMEDPEDKNNPTHVPPTCEKQGHCGDANDNHCQDAVQVEENINSSVGQEAKQCRCKCGIPKAGQRWYNFDDARVSPINSKDIELQFSGKESAYMLFYRRASLSRPQAAIGNPAYAIPDSMMMSIMQENALLEQEREKYEEEVNEVRVQLHFHWNFHYIDGALSSLLGHLQPVELSIDRRKTLNDLYIAIDELGGEITGQEFVLHRMRELPAGFHLYDELTDRDQLLQDLLVENGTMLFVWNGHTVQGTSVSTGLESEPVFLNVTYGNPSHFSRGFPKNMSLEEFRALVSSFTGITPESLILQRIVEQDASSKVVSLGRPKEKEDDVQDSEITVSTLEGLNLKDGDQIIATNSSFIRDSSENKPAMDSVKFFVKVENRCLTSGVCDLLLEVDKNMILSQVKLEALSKFGLKDVHEGGRLRESHCSLGLRPPYQEELSIGDAGIVKDTLLVLEPGRPPRSNEMTLSFTTGNPKGDNPEHEIIVGRLESVNTCIRHMVKKAGLSGMDWHLRRTNWFNEPADVLEDGEATLESCLINEGDHLLLEQGCLPPKGFLRLTVWLYPTTQDLPEVRETESTLAWITNKLAAIFTGNSTSSLMGTSSQLLLGDIDISKDATLEDLRLQILTLPGSADLPVLMPDFLRVRVLEGGQLKTVLRGSQNTLRFLKVPSHSNLAVQILPYEDKVSANQVLLNVRKRDCRSRIYGPVQEIVWDTSSGTSAASLRQAVADCLALSTEVICIAKHFPERCEWLKLEDSHQKPAHGYKKGKRKGKSAKCNMRQSPFYIQDGDVIGVKILADDPSDADDFTTIEDDLGKEKQRQEAEEKKKMREERRKYGKDSTFPKVQRQEVALQIRVDNFT